MYTECIAHFVFFFCNSNKLELRLFPLVLFPLSYHTHTAPPSPQNIHFSRVTHIFDIVGYFLSYIDVTKQTLSQRGRFHIIYANIHTYTIDSHTFNQSNVIAALY